MTETESAPRHPRVSQLRVVLKVDDFEGALAFYRDSLGLPWEVVYPGTREGAQVALLEAGRATLELVDPMQAQDIDELEGVATDAPPPIRLAFEVDDAAAATDDLVASGGSLVAAPVETPWRSLNSRLAGPGGVQLTLFEQLEPE